MHSRRHFLGTMSLPAAAAAFGVPLSATRLEARSVDVAKGLAAHPGAPGDVAADEDFWFEVSTAFTVDRTLVNLNNGGVSPSPAWVQEAMKRHLDFSNHAPPYTMWGILEPQREGVRERMAREWGVDKEEVAFTRNASESLQTMQFGIDLRRGDEVLTTTQDYPRMITTFQQRERREGIVLRQIRIPIPAEDPAEVVRLFEEAITPRTRMILASHMINITGQIMPVRELSAMARRHGIPLVVDGAHALAHFDFTLGELEVDNYSTSLHKWLFAPHGTGLLYVRREKIPEVWPLMAAPERMDSDIRKFEEIGTHPAANYLAIGEALTFHQGIGSARKDARLTYLRNYWADRLLSHDRVRLHTSLRPGFACGIATVQVEGVDTGALNAHLWNRHRILAVGIKHPEFEGIRVSPSVYTTLEELDRFADAVEQVVRNGLPS
ncbi:MAG: aminotransferase class V-fold PLP-dependent enzyme [Gemmatimonadota bacterium]|nr:aminotransferase class V-fold PLP-dependent enzyme [Gemmatimonadota bacterium]MDH5760408.1 aminotransferase class V-fold PLP-dependent enzyme [Gemmatimonadota bacterium]